MKKTAITMFLLLAVVIVFVVPSFAADDAAALYKSKGCVGCHKATGDKIDKTKSDADLAKAITDGIAAKHMPSYKGKLTDDQIKALVTYVKGLK